MANKRILVKRRKSVRNIRKITRTMQLIATARFQAALARATAGRPYTEKLAELVESLSGASGPIDHPLMHASEDATRSAMVVMTSDRGLCGGYNAGVLRAAIHQVDSSAGSGVETDVTMIGRKGVGYFRFLGRPLADSITGIGDRARFEDVEPLANSLMQRFIDGEIASVHVAYVRFHSAGRQTPEVMQLLPLTSEATESTEAKSSTAVEFEFSPEPEELLNELLPATVRIRLFQCLTDAIVSEQIARMTAMKAATDAAGDMIKSLTQRYNRARQTQITMELLDIVGGANALA